MVKALVFGTRDWAFESPRDRIVQSGRTVVFVFVVDTPYQIFVLNSWKKYALIRNVIYSNNNGPWIIVVQFIFIL